MNRIETLVNAFHLNEADARFVSERMGHDEEVVSGIPYSVMEWLKTRVGDKNHRLIAVTREKDILWIFLSTINMVEAIPFQFIGNDPLMELWRAGIADKFKNELLKISLPKQKRSYS